MIDGAGIVGSDAALTAVAEAIARDWGERGIGGHFLGCDLNSGRQCGFGADEPVALASVAKVPIALTALELIDRGELDPGQTIEIDPAKTSPGPTGSALFGFPARIAVADLIALALTVSDNAAIDLVLDVVGITRVAAALAGWGCDGIQIRHPMRTMFDSATRAGGGSFELALELAIAGPPGSASAIEALDPQRGNVASARGLVELLAAVWESRIATPAACAELRRLMSLQLFVQRIAADLRSDAIRVASKTGTFLNLRHDIAVVEANAGVRVAIAALTKAGRRATHAPDVDLAIGSAARSAFEALRG
ncbi:MAG: serine hydrolase [Solirubrobacterales bacterium]|nr:serine hydrolase [Solirubrobacterales bacterium]